MSPEEVRSVVSRCVAPPRFFVTGGRRLRVDYVPREEVFWEIYLGHLLDGSQTRARGSFETWNVLLDDAARAEEDEQSFPHGPLCSIRFDAGDGTLHVCRGLLVRGHETFEPSPGVIDSRPCLKWQTELVGTIKLDRFTDGEHLACELETHLDLAVCGVSRLPITSIETPLPEFSLGNLAYIGAARVHELAPAVDASAGSDLEPRRDWVDLVDAALAQPAASTRQAHLLEAALRSSPEVPIADLAERLNEKTRHRGWSADDVATLFRTLFHNLALSPYTNFVDRMTALLLELARPERLGPEPVVDLFSYMLRQLVRHLTAFDLVTFHNQGANYPDALALDTLLAAYLACIGRHPELFGDGEKRADSRDARFHRLRRRALRQACLVRKQYEGYRVPDEPTSPGENLRVLPAAIAHVPDEQLSQPSRRRRELYSGRPLESLLDATATAVLRRSVDDLSHDAELRELGMSLFLDRPLGMLLPPGHVDRTALLSYEAFSRRIAIERLAQLAAWTPTSKVAAFDALRDRLTRLHVAGIAASELSGFRRPGVVSLEDARLAAADFVITRTTRRSLFRLWERYNLEPLTAVAPDMARLMSEGRGVLLIRYPADANGNHPVDVGLHESATPPERAVLVAYDRNLRPRVELGLEPPDVQPPRDVEPDYLELGGEYCLARGLTVLKVWDIDDASGASRCRDLRSARLQLLPRIET